MLLVLIIQIQLLTLCLQHVKAWFNTTHSHLDQSVQNQTQASRRQPFPPAEENVEFKGGTVSIGLAQPIDLVCKIHPCMNLAYGKKF